MQFYRAKNQLPYRDVQKLEMQTLSSIRETVRSSLGKSDRPNHASKNSRYFDDDTRWWAVIARGYPLRSWGKEMGPWRQIEVLLRFKCRGHLGRIPV